MNDVNILTTLREHNIGTSFTKDSDYFVSTVFQKEMQPSYVYNYSTIIKVAGQTFEPICVLNADSPKEAMMNHIALTRVAISLDKENWNEVVVKEYLPTGLTELLDKEKASQEPKTFLSEYCQLLMQMSGLNCNKKTNHWSLNKIIWIVIGCGLIYWFLSKNK